MTMKSSDQPWQPRRQPATTQSERETSLERARHLSYVATTTRAGEGRPTREQTSRRGSGGYPGEHRLQSLADGEQRPAGSARHVGAAWRTDVCTHAALSELHQAIVTHLDHEAAEQTEVRHAAELIRELLAVLGRELSGPLFLSLIWGDGLPVVIIKVRAPQERMRRYSVTQEFPEYVHRVLNRPLVRKSRVEISEDAGAHIVLVLEMARRR